MSKFNPGDDVIVDFGGECHGEVIRQSNGYVMAVIMLDPELDYGLMSSSLDPRPTVCVPEGRVRLAEK